jgi:aconitase A
VLAPFILNDLNPADLLCRENLQADEGAEYDQLIEINLNELEPHINGPFTPDLAHPLSKFADAIRANGWPSELKVRRGRSLDGWFAGLL